MQIAILYICTGRYTIFWENFFNSCESFFLKNHTKHYFVFTDGEISHSDSFKVSRIEQSKLGWPNDTLKRFHMFAKVKSNLAEYDYIFFFNANAQFCSEINESILPSDEEEIVVVQHPGFFHRRRDAFSYESNSKSMAYILPNQGKYYVCGGVNGGHAAAYLKMIDSLRQAIDEDEKNGVVAIWHDESHINKYILSHPHKLLSPAFCSPEDFHIPFEEKIIILDKERFGGHAYLRSAQHIPPLFTRIKRFVIKMGCSLHDKVLYCKNFRRLHFDVTQSVRVPGFQHRKDKKWHVDNRLYKLLLQKRVAANSIESVYACYVLNYMNVLEMRDVLSRWYEMLRPGGILRLSFPDPYKVHEMYVNMEKATEKQNVFSWFAMQCGDTLEESYCWKQLFCLAELQKELISVGFNKVSTRPNLPHFGSSSYFSEPFYEVVDRSLIRNGKREYVSINLVAYK